MEEDCVMSKKTLYDKVDNKIQKYSRTIGAIVALVTAATGICAWVSNQFQSVVSAQISDLRSEIRESDKEQTLAIARLELLHLMEKDPENTVAILRVAKHYFVDLGGDTWMSEKYSQFADEHGLDASFVVK